MHDQIFHALLLSDVTSAGFTSPRFHLNAKLKRPMPLCKAREGSQPQASPTNLARTVNCGFTGTDLASRMFVGSLAASPRNPAESCTMRESNP